MQLDQVAYFLTVTDISRKDVEELTAIMTKQPFFDGLLVPNQDESELKKNTITFDCGFRGTIEAITREEVDHTMHTLAQTFPEATFTLLCQDMDNQLDQYMISTHKEDYRCSHLISHMPELSISVPFNQRESVKYNPSIHNYPHELLHNTDFDLLYQQKMALLQARDQNAPLPEEVLDGLVNFLDFIGDWAEQEGIFQYPKPIEQESTIDEILRLAKEDMNETGSTIYALPDDRFYIRITVEHGSKNSTNPGAEFYCIKLMHKNAGARAEYSGLAAYEDPEDLRVCCENALKRYEVLSERTPNSLDQKIASASARTPSESARPQKKISPPEIT